MLKTTADQPGKPNKPLLALGILQGYIKMPWWFLLTTLISLPRFREQIPKDLPKEFLKLNALHTWMYIRLKSKIGQEKAYEIIRAVVLPIGLAVQQGNFRNAEVPRTFENLIEYQQRTNREGPTRWNEVAVVEQREQRYEFRVKSCLFSKFHTCVGCQELTKLMCEIDNAIFNTYLPEEITFHRNGIGNSIVDGASECHFVIEHHNVAVRK